MTDQEFSNHAVKVIASLGLIFMLVIGMIYLSFPSPEHTKPDEYISYDYELMIFNSDVHRAEKLAK